ncbi:MAG TPA: ABC transporter permease [Bryobacteraceae bacterium]|jgi:predicted permease|nr:ABC transporter permease [Bryobacteraceae bacterium]
MLSAFHRIIARIRAVFQRADSDRDLEFELEAHVHLLAEDHILRGTPRGEAERLARIELGGVYQLHEAHREIRALPFLDTLHQDLRYTFRTLKQNPGFTAFAILIIGVGVGASSTMFSVTNTLLLQPLPLHDSRRLVWMYNLSDDGVSEWSTQVGHFLDLREQNQSFTDLAAYFAFSQPGDAKITGEGETERVSSLMVSQNFFPMLDVRPVLGRTFTADECHWNAPGTAVMSYGLWKRRYASDIHILGQEIIVNGSAVTIVGVAPSSFDFGTVFAPGNHVDLFQPMPLTQETNSWGNTLAIIGRLRPGATIQSARAEFWILANHLQKQHPERNTLRPVLMPLEEHVTGRLRRALLVLAWAVGIVMLIVCANVANLQLARSATRQKEMAIRVALGAGRRRLIRQMLTESITLSCCGALLGVILAFAGTRMLASLSAFKIPLLSTVRMDAASLGFCLVIAIVTGLLFGLAPALQVPSISVHDTLKDSSRASTGTKRHIWIRSALVVSEIVFACVLLVGAGLLSRSFLNVLDVNLGFQPERAAALRIDPGARYASRAQRMTYFSQVLNRVRSLPGVSAAGVTDVLPLAGDRSWDIQAKGKPFVLGHDPEGFIRIISEGYFQAMGIPLQAGRAFSAADTQFSEPVAVINETAARTLWPAQNAVGQIVLSDGMGRPGRRVVGIVSDVRHRALEQNSGCELYFPISQWDESSAEYLVIRTPLPPPALASSIRAALHPIAPELSTNEFKTLQELVDTAVSPRRFVVLLLAGFSGFALILAALGIYAVISYSVNQRSAELGIRMALGASPSELRASIMLQTLRLAALGMLIGGITSWILARSLNSLLFGVTITDPPTFAGMLITLAAVAALAGYFPSLRVSRIDPIAALRAN